MASTTERCGRCSKHAFESTECRPRDDATAWLNGEIEQLHKKEGDAHEFHKWWHHLLRWGRKGRTGARWFHGDNGEMATTMEEELEGWAAYQEDKAKATDAGQADWE